MSRRAPVFERMAGNLGCAHAEPVGSGTVGLCVLLEALGAAGRRVAIPALACPNVAVAVRAAGAIPVLVEMSDTTYDMSVEALAGTLDESFAAVIVIDAFGYPGDVAGARAAAAPWGCAVVEDACQAYGGAVGGTPVGARGDAGVVSFGYAKPLELLGGGVVLTDDEAVAEQVRRAAESGRYRRLRGLKNRMAVRLMLKDRYEAMIQRDRSMGLLHYEFPRRQLAALERGWDRWLEATPRVRADLHAAGDALARIPGVEPFAYAGRDWLPWRYSFKVAPGHDVDALRRTLQGHGLRTSRLYRPVTEFLDAEVPGPVTAAHALADRTLNLFHRTTADEAARVREAVERAARAMEAR